MNLPQPCSIEPPICLGVGSREVDHQRSEEHTSELQSQFHLVCRLLLEKKKQLGFERWAASPAPSPSPAEPSRQTFPALPSRAPHPLAPLLPSVPAPRR